MESKLKDEIKELKWKNKCLKMELEIKKLKLKNVKLQLKVSMDLSSDLIMSLDHRHEMYDQATYLLENKKKEVAEKTKDLEKEKMRSKELFKQVSSLLDMLDNE